MVPRKKKTIEGKLVLLLATPEVAKPVQDYGRFLEAERRLNRFIYEDVRFKRADLESLRTRAN